MKKALKHCFMVLSLVAIGLSSLVSLPAASAQENSLHLVLGTEPPTIDPGIATDSTSGAIIRNVFEGLYSVDVDGNYIPAVAESHEVSEDGLVYTFKLREGVQWSNGDPVTAGDFVYAWKRVLNPETASQYASILYPVAGAEAYNTGEGDADGVQVHALDDLTLEVHLEYPTPYFIELTAFYTYMPVHQATVEANPDWAAGAGESYVTNGPYDLAEWNHNANVLLTKSESYWDQDNVSVESVNMQIIESEATANSEFQAGTLDYLGLPFGTVSLDSIDLYREQGILQTAPYSAIYWYKVNTTDPVMGNENIRKALGLAIDRQSLIDNVIKGGQIPALGYVPPTMEGFIEDRGYFADADFEGAQSYLQAGLKELGLSDPSELNIELAINTSEAHSAIAQFIQAGWAEHLGINVSIRNSEWQVYLDELQNLQFQVARLGWIADYNDPTSFLDMYKTAETGNNDTGWENPDFAGLLDQAALEQDPEARLDIILEAEALMISELPVIPIYYYTNNYVVKDGIENLKPDALGNVLLKYVTINQ